MRWLRAFLILALLLITLPGRAVAADGAYPTAGGTTITANDCGSLVANGISAAGILACAAAGAGVVTSITGTADQVTVGGTAAVPVLSLPNPIVRNVTGNVSGSSGSTTGNAATATALAADGANCSAGSFPLGVDASGAAQNCTALPTTITGTANEITVSASTGPITFSIPSALTFTGKTITGGTFASPTFSGTAAGTYTLGGTPSIAYTALTGMGTGVATFLATPSSANLLAALTDETGTGAAVFGTSPTIAAPVLSGTTTGTYTLGGTPTITNPTINAATFAGTFAGTPTISGAWTWSVAQTMPGLTLTGSGAGYASLADSSGNYAWIATGAGINSCPDAGSTDTYACSITDGTHSLQVYVTGMPYRFKAATLNTGTASINFNSLGAKTIVKVLGGITTALVTGDILAGQWVELIYDGTNMQMTSQSALMPQPAQGGTGSANTATAGRHLIGDGTNFITASGVEEYCLDAVGTDTYACNLSPAITAYITGARYAVKVGTLNTGAATINLNGLGAKSIVKVCGGVTTALVTGDILAGQVIDLAYDGTNMQLQSTIASGLCTALTGDVTTAAGGVVTTIAANAVTSPKMAVANTYWVCDMMIGGTDEAVLTDANIGPQNNACTAPAAITVVEVRVIADGGTPSALPRNTTVGLSSTNFLSGALATGASGVVACSNTGGTTSIYGTTTCTNTLTSTTLAAGARVGIVSGTAGGVAKQLTVTVIGTRN
jgi:hypothetical protein